MTEEPESLILELLRQMRAELGDVRSDVSQLRAESADATSKSLAAGEHPEKVTSSETIK